MQPVRFLITILTALLLTLVAWAQNTLSCPDGSEYTGAISLGLPANENHPTLPEGVPAPYFVNVIGLNGSVPVLAVAGENNLKFCSRQDPIAAGYAASLPSTGEVLPSPLSAGAALPMPGAFQVQLTTVDGTAGEYLVFIDGGSSVRQDRAGDVYEIAVTAEMVASGLPLTVYLFALDGQYDPALSLVDENGRIIRDDNNRSITCDTAGDVEDCYGEAVTLENASISGYLNTQYAGTARDAMLTIPLTDTMTGTTLRLRVDTNHNTSGIYSLVLHLGSGAKPSTDVRAELSENDDSTLSLTCNGEKVFDSGVRIALPPLSASRNYKVTLLSSGTATPVLAVFNAAGEGLCYQKNPAAAFYEALLPATALPASALSAQAVLPADATALVAGNRDNLPDNLLIIIEGFTVTAGPALPPTATPPAESTPAALPPPSMPETISGDVFEINVSPGMATAGDDVVIFMMAAVNELNPFMAQVDKNGAILTGPDGMPAACDDAGVPFLCQTGTEGLTGYRLTLADTRFLPGFGQDAMLRLAVLPDMAGQTLRIVTSSSGQQTGGDYVLVLKIAPK